MNNPLPLHWTVVAAALETFQPASGGFTTAMRGIVTLENGQNVFIKIGNDTDTKRWTAKEIAIYEFLGRQNVSLSPQLLAVNSDQTAFAINALEPSKGWDWTDSWTETRLIRTLEGMDAIAAIKPVGTDKALFETSFVDEHADGWRQFIKQPELQTLLQDRLLAFQRGSLSQSLDFEYAAIRSSNFTFMQDSLVHNDVRADNCAWNAVTQRVQFVDWTWAQFGDRRIDTNSLLVHVQKTGFDVHRHQKHRLDAEALHWLAGFWFASAIRPIPKGGPERAALRDHQLESGIVAYELAQSLTGAPV